MNEAVHVLANELAFKWTPKGLTKEQATNHRADGFGRCLITLLAEFNEPGSGGDGGGGGKVTGSPAPWAADVELLLGDIDAGARSLEIDLCRVLAWDTIERGGSRANTQAAILRLPQLVDQLEAARPDHWLVRGDWNDKRKRHGAGEVQRRLSTWHRQARVVLGIEKHYAILPTPCTAEGCGERALRARPHGGVICGRCGETYTDHELHDWFFPIDPSPQEESA